MNTQEIKFKKNTKFFIGIILLIIPLFFSIYGFCTRLNLFKLLSGKNDRDKKLAQTSNSLDQQAQTQDQQNSSLFVSCGGFIE